MTTSYASLTPAGTKAGHVNYDFVLGSWGLYEPVLDWPTADINGVSLLRRWLTNFAYGTAKFDIYCESCKKTSTFDGEYNHVQSLSVMKGNFVQVTANDSDWTWFNRVFVCARKDRHRINVCLSVKNGTTLIKYGQQPSIADLTAHDLDDFAVILGRDRLTELKRGVGLHAHGIGIGSLIYLRRTLEFLISEAEIRCSLDAGSLPYDKMKFRAEEKIKALGEYMPAFLVANRKMYGVLSGGLHGLSEEECASLFPACYAGLKIALDDLLQSEAKKKKIADVAKDIVAAEKVVEKLLASKET
jgi:hypothetical protein